MELMGIVQEGARLLFHAPSGRPRVISSAITRSVVVSALAARNFIPSLHIYRYTLWALLASAGLLAINITRTAVELFGLGAQQVGSGVYSSLQLLYGLVLCAIIIPAVLHKTENR